MAKVIVMPKLGLTMTEGTVSKWLKAEGDAVKEGEPLFEVETDKLTNTIEASASGTLLKIAVPAGGEAKCLDPVAVIGEPGEDVSALIGVIPAAGAAAPAPAAPAAAAPAASAPARAPGERVLASPAAKKLARELGIDLALVPGTGPKGRVTEDDVKNFKSAPPPAPPAPPAEPAVKASPLAAKVAADIGLNLKDVPAHGRVLAADILAAVQKGGSAPAEEAPREETVPMSGMRKAIARNMLNSHMTSPTVTFNLGIDMTELQKLREQLKGEEIKVSYTDILVKVVARALTEFTLLNC